MRTCTICNHKKRQQIEAAIAAGESYRGISQSFRGVSEDALGRHKNQHMQPLVQQVVEERQAETKQVLKSALDRVLRDLAIIDAALTEVWDGDKKKDLETLLTRLLPESRQQNKLYGTFTGELRKQVSLTASPEFEEMMGAFFTRLEAYPAARDDMLTWLEDERAKRRGA